ncbi:MAG: class I adenylate-forming enzyme family protein [Acidobacteriota bacterium]
MSSLRVLFEPLHRAVRDAPDVIRLREFPSGTSMDGTQLLDAVSSQAAVLRRAGVAPGDCVLIRCPNSAAFVVAVLACWEADASCLLTDGASTQAEIERLVGLFHPAAALGVPADKVARCSPSLICWSPGRSEGSHPSLPRSTAAIKLTSGTTGRARGVVVTCSQLIAGGRQILQTMNIQPGDINIGAISMSHSYGFDNLILPLALQGSPIAVLPAGLPEHLMAALGMRESCVFPGVPYLFDLLTRTRSAARPSGLRLCISAGSPLPSAVARAFQDRFGLDLHSFYGTTETGGIAFEREPQDDPVEGCVGTPLEGVHLTLEPQPGTGTDPDSGRVVVRSAAVAQGCWPVDLSSEDPAGGRFATADLGRLDEHGRLHLVGRLNHLVNVAGRKVNPVEVEQALRALPRVRDAAIVTVRDPRRGQALGACVEAERGLRRESILEALGERLPRYKIPRVLRVVQALPRTQRGKPDLTRIRDLLASDRAASRAD